MHELELKFLVAARDRGVYLKFIRWKNVKNNNKKYKSNFYRCVLLDEIHNKHQSIKQLKKDVTTSMENLPSATTLFISVILRISKTPLKEVTEFT